MKFFLKIDKEQPPSVTVVCNRVTGLVAQVEKLCEEWTDTEELLYGYSDGEIVPLDLSNVVRFYTLDGKVYASTLGGDYVVKLRIKQVLELVDSSFIRINQGCVANVRMVEKFAVSFGGALKIVFKNGQSDYVSRRELANIKRRFGL